MKNLLVAGVAALVLSGCEEMGAPGGTVPAGGSMAAGTGTETADGSGGTGGLSSLINVNVSDIAAEVAKNVNLNLEDVPISVQLPVNVAANVCGVDVNLLSAQLNAGSSPSCSASTTSAELEQAITNRI